MNTNRIAHLFDDIKTPGQDVSSVSIENPFAKLDLSDEEQSRCGAAQVSVVVKREEGESSSSSSSSLTISTLQAVQGAVNEALAMARQRDPGNEPLAVRVDRAELYADAVKVDVILLILQPE